MSTSFATCWLEKLLGLKDNDDYTHAKAMKAWRKLLFQCHPDKCVELEEFPELVFAKTLLQPSSKTSENVHGA